MKKEIQIYHYGQWLATVKVDNEKDLHDETKSLADIASYEYYSGPFSIGSGTFVFAKETRKNLTFLVKEIT